MFTYIYEAAFRKGYQERYSYFSTNFLIFSSFDVSVGTELLQRVRRDR